MVGLAVVFLQIYQDVVTATPEIEVHEVELRVAGHDVIVSERHLSRGIVSLIVLISGLALLPVKRWWHWPVGICYSGVCFPSCQSFCTTCSPSWVES